MPEPAGEGGSLTIERTIFSEEHDIFRAMARRFMETEIAPNHARWEEEGAVDREAWRKAGAAGLLCCDMPEEYGGPGADFLCGAIVIEELARVGATGPGYPLHSDICAPYILHHGSEEQKREWLPRMASGEAIAAVAMSEPGTGSDLQGVRTRAVRDGNEFVLNGQKTFITNGQNADLVIVVAKTDPDQGARGISLFLVEADRGGFSRGRNLKKIGMKAQDTSELFFEDVRLPPANMLGGEGEGFFCLMNELPRERLLIAIRALSTAEAAIDWTVEYTKERQAFGQRIADFQNTRFRLAEMATECTVGRVFVDRCIALQNEGKFDAETAAMAKLWASELEGRVLDECLQLHGGYGYMWEYPIARAWADARVQRIFGGTSEIMKEVIGRAVLGDRRKRN